MATKIDSQLRLLFKNPSKTPVLPMPVQRHVVQLLGQVLAQVVRPAASTKREPRHEHKD